LLLTVQGQQVVAAEQRRVVDAHWQRGNSYFRIGWDWFKGILYQGWHWCGSISLSGKPDPEPAFASQKQKVKQSEREFTVQSYSYTS
jgi:hypothetical protein